MANAFQLYVTFSGESSKGQPNTTNTPINHVRAYDQSGTAHGRVTPDYDELRGMATDPNGRFYLAVANKSVSAIDAFSAAINADGYSRNLLGTAVTPQTSTALSHPYDLTFNGAALFASNQDTNVVAGYVPAVAGFPAEPLDIASYLTTTFPSGGTFYPGTYVASAQPVTVGDETPPVVPVVQGGLTMTGFNPPSATRHSVRGILFVDGTLYVADEGGARVGMYDAGSGAFTGSLSATSDGKYTFATPVGLALDPTSGHIYIGDPGNDAIFRYHPSSGKTDVVVDKRSGGAAVEKVSGLAVDSDGTLYFASRKAQSISTIDKKGNVKAFAAGLTDTPECLLIVPV